MFTSNNLLTVPVFVFSTLQVFFFPFRRGLKRQAHYLGRRPVCFFSQNFSSSPLAIIKATLLYVYASLGGGFKVFFEQLFFTLKIGAEMMQIDPLFFNGWFNHELKKTNILFKSISLYIHL